MHCKLGKESTPSHTRYEDHFPQREDSQPLKHKE
jgi:hypothetical protein